MNNEIMSKVYSSPFSSDYSSRSSENRFSLTNNMAKFLLNKDWEGLSILDYGCGPGNMFDWMNRNGVAYGKYYGYDVRKETIEHAKKIQSNNVIFSTEIPKEMYNVVFMLGTISYQYTNDVDRCKEEAISLILNANSFSNECFVFTLPKDSYKSISTKRMIRFSEREVFDILTRMKIGKLVFDSDSFQHEMLIGCKKNGT